MLDLGLLYLGLIGKRRLVHLRLTRHRGDHRAAQTLLDLFSRIDAGASFRLGGRVGGARRTVVTRATGGPTSETARLGACRETDERGGYLVRQLAVDRAWRRELHCVAADQDLAANVVIFRMHVDYRVDPIWVFFDRDLS